MTDIVLQTVQWKLLTDIDDVRPISESDATCLNEIREVLEKHGCLDRFGVALLHRHFELQDDEMMLETTDVSAREHWVRPVKTAYLAQIGLEAQTTVVSFDKNGYSQNCGCLRDKHGHTGRHT